MRINLSDYVEMKIAQEKLACLEAAGVDDWEGYCEALEEYDEANRRTELSNSTSKE